MRRLGIVGAAAVLAAALLPLELAGAGPAATNHYPDLQTQKPTDLHITRSCSFLLFGSCKKYLRFSNTVGNLGAGRLEIRPENNSTTGKTKAYQRIYSHNASGGWFVAEERLAGEFTFHPSHNHYHFSDFANYNLVRIQADGSVDDQYKRSSQKTTFCIIDTTRVSSTIEHAGSQTYTRCGQNDLTGLTVGWGDTYGANLPGQEIDITSWPNGTYLLVSTADFRNRIVETNERNNQYALKIQISGTTVTEAP